MMKRKRLTKKPSRSRLASPISIPNGTITGVSNETHGWSRANIEVGVAYQEDVDHICGVLAELARDFRADANFAPMILDDATPPAVDSFGESSVLIKFAIKTKPNQQGPVKRELLRRINELGIEFPFPHRTVYHRYESVTEVPTSLPAIQSTSLT